MALRGGWEVRSSLARQFEGVTNPDSRLRPYFAIREGSLDGQELPGWRAGLGGGTLCQLPTRTFLARDNLLSPLLCMGITTMPRVYRQQYTREIPADAHRTTSKNKK